MKDIEAELRTLSFSAGVQSAFCIIIQRLEEDPARKGTGTISIQKLIDELEKLYDIHWESDFLDKITEMLKDQKEQSFVDEVKTKAFHCLDLHD